MKARSVLIPALALGVTVVLGVSSAAASPITLTYAVTVNSWCTYGGGCVPYSATFPLTVTFDDQPTDTQTYREGPSDPNFWYIIRYFGAPTMSATPLPTLANPYGGVVASSAFSRALFQSDNVAVGGYRQGILHTGQMVSGGEWQVGTQLLFEAPAAFPPLNAEMPTAQSLVALLSGTVRFVQFGMLLNESAAGEGYYDGTATLQTPVPEPSTLLLIGTGLAAVVARRRLRKRT